MGGSSSPHSGQPDQQPLLHHPQDGPLAGPLWLPSAQVSSFFAGLGRSVGGSRPGWERGSNQVVELSVGSNSRGGPAGRRARVPAGGASRVASRQSAALCTPLHSLTSCTHSLLASQHSSPDRCHGSMLTYNWGSVTDSAGGCAQWSLLAHACCTSCNVLDTGTLKVGRTPLLPPAPRGVSLGVLLLLTPPPAPTICLIVHRDQLLSDV